MSINCDSDGAQIVPKLYPGLTMKMPALVNFEHKNQII